LHQDATWKRLETRDSLVLKGDLWVGTLGVGRILLQSWRGINCDFPNGEPNFKRRGGILPRGAIWWLCWGQKLGVAQTWLDHGDIIISF
ncbi:hypothetical protein TNIN_130921, partial [Trichonephila inaurata madagascariensis]